MLECPKCNSKEIGKGKQSDFARMFPVKGVFKTGTDVIYNICTNCGYIIDAYVDEPHKFKI